MIFVMMEYLNIPRFIFIYFTMISTSMYMKISKRLQMTGVYDPEEPRQFISRLLKCEITGWVLRSFSTIMYILFAIIR